MQFTILEAESIYRRLLAITDPTEREQVFCAELAEPFAPLARVFGGDPLAMFRQWGMTAEMFAGEQRDHWQRTLDQLAAHDAWNRAAASLVRGWQAFEPYADRIPRGDIVFALLLCDMSAQPGARGYSGFGAFPGYIMTVYGDANGYNLPRVEACTVHEFHHNILARIFPFNPMSTTVAEYMVMEGLAESFAADLYGEATTGYWVSEFDETRLDDAKRIMHAGLEKTGFDVIRGYIFGSAIAQLRDLPDPDLPDYAGYAIGYRVVQAYLQRTGQSVVEATFIPANQIIAESRYFD